MELPSYSDISRLIVLILLTIFEFQICCRSRIIFLLFCVCVTLHLKLILNGLNDEIDITDLLMSFFILWISYFQRSSNSICHKTCKAPGIDNYICHKTCKAPGIDNSICHKTCKVPGMYNSICHKTCKVPWIDNSEKSKLADLLPNNNRLNKAGIKCEQCSTVVCSLWDSGQMGRPVNRLRTFLNRQLNIKSPPPVLVENGFFYNEESSAVQCFRFMRTLSPSDVKNNPHSWHEEYCDFVNFRSENYKDLFQDQESEIHQQISEGRRHNRADTAQNAAGSGQIGALPQAESQSTDGGGLALPSRDSTVTSSLLPRTQTSPALERSPESAHAAAFYEHLGIYPRTSFIARDHCSNSEPANMVYTEITPTREPEGGQQWQSQAEVGRNTDVSVEPWASTQTVGGIVMNLPASHRELATGYTAAARTTPARRIMAAIRRRRDRSSRQHKCCCIS